jgi:cell division protein FtsL
MNGIMRNTFIRMAAIALVLFCGILFVTLRLENNALAAKADNLKEEAELLREDINELKADLERPFDAKYIAEVAEEKLGLRYPQEVVFYTGENE